MSVSVWLRVGDLFGSLTVKQFSNKLKMPWIDCVFVLVLKHWLCRLSCQGLYLRSVSYCTKQQCQQQQKSLTNKEQEKKLDNYGRKVESEGFRPGWYISTTIYCRDIPFWSETLEILHAAEEVMQVTSGTRLCKVITSVVLWLGRLSRTQEAKSSNLKSVT